MEKKWSQPDKALTFAERRDKMKKLAEKHAQHEQRVMDDMRRLLEQSRGRNN
jgi:hypothetical protein